MQEPPREHRVDDQDPTFYFNREYVSPARFLSFYEQLRMLVALEIESLLEVGIGNGIFQFLAKQLGKDVRTFDHNAKLKPDCLGSILDPLPFDDNSFDAATAFEVFEHFPLSLLQPVLQELSRVCTRYVLFSVPNRDWYVRASLSTNYFRLSKILTIRRFLKVWEPRKDYDPHRDMHYWHIGDRGVSSDSIRAICESAELTVEKDYRSIHNPNHHFFLLRCFDDSSRIST